MLLIFSFQHLYSHSALHSYIFEKKKREVEKIINKIKLQLRKHSKHKKIIKKKSKKMILKKIISFWHDIYIYGVWWWNELYTRCIRQKGGFLNRDQGKWNFTKLHTIFPSFSRLSVAYYRIYIQFSNKFILVILIHI